MNKGTFENAYLALIKDNRIFESSLLECADMITRQCTLSLSASQASVWVTSEDASELRCISLHRSDLDSYEQGAILNGEVVPRYISALQNSRVVAAHDASEDPRTSELTSFYLKPLDVRSLLDATLRSQGEFKGVLCIEMKGQQRIWTNEEQMFVASVADLISQRMIVDDLARSESNYESLYRYSSEGIAVFKGNKFADVNPAACKMYGGSREEIVDKSPVDLSPEFQSDGQLSSIKAMSYINACLNGTPQNFEWTHKRVDGTEFYADITLNAVRIADDDTLFAMIRDITDKKLAEEQAIQAQKKLVYRAAHDSLTGLMNRYQLHNHIAQIISKDNDKSKTSIVALLLDLNRFKEVNDTLGHCIGDKVLVKLAAILDKRVKEIGGDLFRLGGDEFVAVFDNQRCCEPFVNIESILHESLKTSIELDDISIEMGASIGIALYPENGRDSHELLRCADVAMYHAKNNDVVSSWYDAQNDLNNKRRLAMIVELGSAIKDDQLVLHFQPRINLETRAVTGCEALVRWQHPKHGLVSPSEFLPLAEMNELIHPLSEWVLNDVVRQIKKMVDKGYYVPVAMNVSARNLTDSQLVDKLRELIIAENIDPQLLEVEITESALINHPQRAVENLEKLDELGVQIAIDDFGTGYSSLSYLKKLPVNTLKIDRSFVVDMLTDGSDSVIVDSIIDLAHNFSLTVIAEGVEDQPTLDALVEKKCDQAQGYLIAMPLAEEEFDEWLDNQYQQQFSQHKLRIFS